MDYLVISSGRSSHESVAVSDLEKLNEGLKTTACLAELNRRGVFSCVLDLVKHGADVGYDEITSASPKSPMHQCCLS